MKKSIVDTNPELIKEWDFVKNNELNILPDEVSQGSHKKVWWKCEQGHSWQSIVSNRARLGRSCPYCARQLPIPGVTDIMATNPEILEEWNFDRNVNIEPKTIMAGTHKKVWWKCKFGHEWQAEVKSRISGVGCPVCAGKKVLKGFNDLETLKPELAKEWNYENNGDLLPSMVTAGSGKKVWWLCPNKHHYKAAIYNRNKGEGCPVCIKSQRTSFPEQAIYYYVKQVFPDAINGYNGIFENSMELDVYIPSLRIGIEYDGRIYHSERSNIARDSKKYSICKKNNIKLIRVVETKWYPPIINYDVKIEIPSANAVYLNSAIIQICMKLGAVPNINVKRDRNLIQAYLDKRRSSLAIEYPNVAREWNYDKNQPLIPEQFASKSNQKVWWQCSVCGNEWQAAIGDRNRKEATGCPRCAAKRSAEKRIAGILATKGSAADLLQNVLQDWDYKKNEFLPSQVTKCSSKKIAWKCKSCGYEWESTINHKIRGRSCPACSNRVIIVGRNDLATLRPELLKDWDYLRNPIKPEEVTTGSGKKAFWKCHKCGYEWEAIIGSRAKGAGCWNCYNIRRCKNK